MKNYLRRSLLTTVVVALAYGALSCGSRDYSGAWQGTTADGKEVSFTVQNNTISKVKVAYSLQCESGGFCPLEGSFEADAGDEITSDSFSTTLGIVHISGKFDSATSVSGELKGEKQDPRCGKCKVSGDWSAKKL